MENALLIRLRSEFLDHVSPEPMTGMLKLAVRDGRFYFELERKS